MHPIDAAILRGGQITHTALAEATWTSTAAGASYWCDRVRFGATGCEVSPFPGERMDRISAVWWARQDMQLARRSAGLPALPELLIVDDGTAVLP